MIADHRIAVVIPCYRVEGQIAGVLDRMPECVDRIYVINDASPDDTAGVVSRHRDPRITLLSHGRNAGVGGAMVTGFKAALAEDASIVVKCDGDGQMDPQLIPALVRPLVDGGVEYSKACRFHHAAELKTMPAVRLLGNIGLTLLTKCASGYWHLLDPQNGFLAIRAGALRLINLSRLARDYFFENDLMIRLNSIGARAIDVPMPARYGDEASSLVPWRAFLSFPPRLFVGFIRRILWRYVFYDVSPVAVLLGLGALLSLFGTVFGAYHWFMNARRGLATPTGTIIIATVTLILGFQLLLQATVLDIQSSPRPGSRSSLEDSSDT
jgi:glycosyltransferase involved in cell wall biosynthesis